jgi:hypothetical protein
MAPAGRVCSVFTRAFVYRHAAPTAQVLSFGQMIMSTIVWDKKIYDDAIH